MAFVGGESDLEARREGAEGTSEGMDDGGREAGGSEGGDGYFCGKPTFMHVL